MSFLKGKKTMLGSVGIGLVVIASSLSLINEQTAGIALGLLATWTGVSMRLAVKG